MKKATLLFVLLTYFLSSDAGVRIIKTNWPDMGLNCIIVNNNRVSVDLILEANLNNSSTFSNFRVVINNRSIPISFFNVSSNSSNGYYKYTYRYTESHTVGDDQFEYKIDYISLPPNVFKVYGSQSNTSEKKPICNPNNELPDYLKLLNNQNKLTPNIHPNPFNNDLTIEYNIDSKNDMTVDIIDLNGKVLLSHKQKDTQISIAEQKFNTRKLAPGIYYCRIFNNSSNSITKLVKAK